MQLLDRVEILDAAESTDAFGNAVQDWSAPTVVARVRAHVSYRAVAVVADGGRMAMIEQLRAIIDPFPFEEARHRIRWRGSIYMADGPEMVRRRNGVDHHLTIPLRAVSG